MLDLDALIGWSCIAAALGLVAFVWAVHARRKQEERDRDAEFLRLWKEREREERERAEEKVFDVASPGLNWYVNRPPLGPRPVRFHFEDARPSGQRLRRTSDPDPFPIHLYPLVFSGEGHPRGPAARCPAPSPSPPGDDGASGCDGGPSE